MTGAPVANESHWSRHAPQWDLLGPPLRPSPEDVATYAGLVRSAATDGGAAHTVILGVTPEIVGLGWPPRARVTAVDRSHDMIRQRGAGDAAGAVCADWCVLPLGPECCDLVIGDFSFNALGGRQAVAALVTEIHRVLRPGGRLIQRIAIRPDQPEAVPALIADLRAGRIGSFHAFKWRLAMALHHCIDAGVCLADIWKAWREAVPDPEMLLRDLSWNPALVNTIDVYRGVRTRYTFPTRNEARALFAVAFEERSFRTAGYELGERCPVVEMARR